MTMFGDWNRVYLEKSLWQWLVTSLSSWRHYTGHACFKVSTCFFAPSGKTWLSRIPEHLGRFMYFNFREVYNVLSLNTLIVANNSVYPTFLVYISLQFFCDSLFPLFYFHNIVISDRKIVVIKRAHWLDGWQICTRRVNPVMTSQLLEKERCRL